MKKLVSLNGIAPKATKTHRCQAKGCVNLGPLRSLIHPVGRSRWNYFLCDEHFLLLRKVDKQYIARTLGTKAA
jgi:hypothetical protein